MPFKVMKTITHIIRKVAEQASKLVLFGALVSGVGMTSYATETTVGPTIEKAQLETVHINLESVAKAIIKIDENLSKMNRPALVVSKSATVVTYGVTADAGGNLRLTPSPVSPESGNCGDEEIPCRIEFDTNILPIQNDANGNYVQNDPSKYTPIGWGGYQ